MADPRWIVVLQALDKPGTLTAVAAAFSNRGVSLEAILGSGIANTTVENGRLILQFQATVAKQILLKRALERLPFIFQVTVYNYEDERLRAIAATKLAIDTDLGQLSSELQCDVIATTVQDQIVLLSGRTTVVDAAIAQLRQANQLKDVVISTITV